MYTIFEEQENGLLIKLNDRGREELEDLTALHKEKGPVAIWFELNEAAFYNGYQDIRPEVIGALTSSPIIANDFIDEETTQEDLDNTKIWWFPNYMIIDEVEELLTKGEVFFLLAPKSE